MRSEWAAAVFMSLTACGGHATDSPAWLEVGTGEERFHALGEGSDVALVAGPQGGWHLWLALRAGGIAAGPAEVRVRAEPHGWDGPRQERWWWISLESVEGEPFCERTGVAAVLSPAECLRDRPLRLTVSLSGEGAASAEDSLVVVPRAPASPEMPPCEE